MPKAKPPTAPSASTKIKALRLMCFSSAKRPVATRNWPSFDQLGQDPTLPFIQGFVHFRARVPHLVEQRVDRLANHLLLTRRRVQPIEQAIQNETPTAKSKAASAMPTRAIVSFVMMTSKSRSQTQQTGSTKQKTKHFSAPSPNNLGAHCEERRSATVKKR